MEKYIAEFIRFTGRMPKNNELALFVLFGK